MVNAFILLDCENVSTDMYRGEVWAKLYYFVNHGQMVYVNKAWNTVFISMDIIIIDTYLGWLIVKNGNEHEYYIVSRDKGFDYVVSFLERTRVYCKAR